MTRFFRGLQFALVPAVVLLASSVPAQAVPLTPFPDGGTLEGGSLRFRPAFFDIFVDDPLLSWLPAVQNAVPGGFTFDTSMFMTYSLCALGSCTAESMAGNATAFLSDIQNPDGSFDTEMLAMNLSGASPLGPMLVRESPSRPSLGQVRLNGLPPGQPVHIDSFFDIFVELSIDGGQTWMPAMSDGDNPIVESDRFSTPLSDVPEPSTLVLAGAGFLLVASRLRRARKS